MRVQNLLKFACSFTYAGEISGKNLAPEALSPSLPISRYFHPALQADLKKGKIKAHLSEAEQAIVDTPGACLVRGELWLPEAAKEAEAADKATADAEDAKAKADAEGVAEAEKAKVEADKEALKIKLENEALAAKKEAEAQEAKAKELAEAEGKTLDDEGNDVTAKTGDDEDAEGDDAEGDDANTDEDATGDDATGDDATGDDDAKTDDDDAKTDEDDAKPDEDAADEDATDEDATGDDETETDEDAKTDDDAKTDEEVTDEEEEDEVPEVGPGNFTGDHLDYMARKAGTRTSGSKQKIFDEIFAEGNPEEDIFNKEILRHVADTLELGTSGTKSDLYDRVFPA